MTIEQFEQFKKILKDTLNYNGYNVTTIDVMSLRRESDFLWKVWIKEEGKDWKIIEFKSKRMNMWNFLNENGDILDCDMKI